MTCCGRPWRRTLAPTRPTITPTRTILLVAAAASLCYRSTLVSADVNRSANSKRKRPNVLFLLADDMGYGDLPCYGHPYARAPNICDRLAGAGTIFENFHVTGITCNPSRTGFMCSRHPATFPNYMADWGLQGVQTVTQMLRDEAGYNTGHFGKWHIGPDPPLYEGKRRARRPSPLGGIFRLGSGGNAMSPASEAAASADSGNANRVRDGSEDSFRHISSADDIKWRDSAKSTKDPKNPSKAGKKSKSSKKKPVDKITYGIKDIQIIGGKRKDKAGRDNETYQAAMKFIKNHVEEQRRRRERRRRRRMNAAYANIFEEDDDEEDEPFYANVWGHIPHTPISAPPELTKLFDDVDVNPDNFPPHMRDKIREFGSKKKVNKEMREYLAEIWSVDKVVGQMLDLLDDLGIADNTIVVFSSDQGASPSAMGSGGNKQGGKFSYHQGGVNVPFIVKWTNGVPAGAVNSQSLISALDWTPTLLSLAGVEYDPAWFEGEDVTDIWTSNDTNNARSRTNPLFWKTSGKREKMAMLYDKWKLHIDGGRKYLYDLEKDPGEEFNVLSKYPDVGIAMLAELKAWRKTLPDGYCKKDDKCKVMKSFDPEKNPVVIGPPPLLALGNNDKGAIVVDDEFDYSTALPTSDPATAGNEMAEESSSPMSAPTSVPTVSPTSAPSGAPTVVPSASPTSVPTVAPTAVPTGAPTASPTSEPTSDPTLDPTPEPTYAPTVSPSSAPSAAPTVVPSASPSSGPTTSPSSAPTAVPTGLPTSEPTSVPTSRPSASPTKGSESQRGSSAAGATAARSTSSSPRCQISTIAGVPGVLLLVLVQVVGTCWFLL